MNDTDDLELENGKLRLRCRHLQETLNHANTAITDMREEIEGLKLKVLSLEAACSEKEQIKSHSKTSLGVDPELDETVSDIFSDETAESKIIMDMFRAHRYYLLVNTGLSLKSADLNPATIRLEDENGQFSSQTAEKFAVLSKLLISKHFCDLLLHAYGELKTFVNPERLPATIQGRLEMTDTSFMSSSQRTEFFDAEDFSSQSQKAMNEIESKSVNTSEASCMESSETVEHKTVFFDWLKNWIFHFINLIEQRHVKFMEFSIVSLKASFFNLRSIQRSILEKLNNHIVAIIGEGERYPIVQSIQQMAMLYETSPDEEFELLFLHIDDNHLENIRSMMPVSELGNILMDSTRLMESSDFVKLIHEFKTTMHSLKKALLQSKEQSIDDSESYIRCSLALLDIFLCLNDIFAGKSEEVSSKMQSIISNVTGMQEFEKCKDMNQVWKSQILQNTFLNRTGEDLCLRFERLTSLLVILCNNLKSKLEDPRIEIWMSSLINITRYSLDLLVQLRSDDFEMMKFILTIVDVVDSKHCEIELVSDAGSHTEFFSEESETPKTRSVNLEDEKDLEKFEISTLPSFASTASFQIDLPAVLHQVEIMQAALEKSSCEIEALRAQMKNILHGRETREDTKALDESSLGMYQALENRIAAKEALGNSQITSAQTNSAQRADSSRKSGNAILYSLWIDAGWMIAMFDKGYSLKSLIAGIAIDLKRAISLTVDVKVIYHEFAKVVKESSSFTSDGALYILFVVHSDELELEDFEIVMRDLNLRHSIGHMDSWISNTSVKDIKFEGPISKHVVMLLDTIINSGGKREATMEGGAVEFEKRSRRDVNETLELSTPASMISFSAPSDEREILP